MLSFLTVILLLLISLSCSDDIDGCYPTDFCSGEYGNQTYSYQFTCDGNDSTVYVNYYSDSYCGEDNLEWSLPADSTDSADLTISEMVSCDSTCNNYFYAIMYFDAENCDTENGFEEGIYPLGCTDDTDDADGELASQYIECTDDTLIIQKFYGSSCDDNDLYATETYKSECSDDAYTEEYYDGTVRIEISRRAYLEIVYCGTDSGGDDDGGDDAAIYKPVIALIMVGIISCIPL